MSLYVPAQTPESQAVFHNAHSLIVRGYITEIMQCGAYFGMSQHFLQGGQRHTVFVKHGRDAEAYLVACPRINLHTYEIHKKWSGKGRKGIVKLYPALSADHCTEMDADELHDLALANIKRVTPSVFTPLEEIGKVRKAQKGGR